MKIPCGGFELNSDDFKFNENNELSLQQSGGSGGDSGYEVQEMVIVPEQTIVVDDPEFGQYDVTLSDGAYDFLIDAIDNNSQYLNAVMVIDDVSYECTVQKENDIDISITYNKDNDYIQCYISYGEDESVSAYVGCSIGGEHVISIDASDIVVSPELSDIIQTQTHIIYVDTIYDESTHKVTLVPSAEDIAADNGHIYYLWGNNNTLYQYHSQSRTGVRFQNVSISANSLYVDELFFSFDGDLTDTVRAYDLSSLLQNNP